MPTRIGGIGRVAALTLLAIVAASIAAPQSESLNSIALELGSTIEGVSQRDAIHRPAVLVEDFVQTHGERSGLGTNLADRFSRALASAEGPRASGTSPSAFHVLKAHPSPSRPDNDLKGTKANATTPNSERPS